MHGRILSSLLGNKLNMKLNHVKMPCHDHNVRGYPTETWNPLTTVVKWWHLEIVMMMIEVLMKDRSMMSLKILSHDNLCAFLCPVCSVELGIHHKRHVLDYLVN